MPIVIAYNIMYFHCTHYQTNQKLILMLCKPVTNLNACYFENLATQLSEWHVLLLLQFLVR